MPTPAGAHGESAAWTCGETITVSGSPHRSWGLRRAIRTWNRVDAGQPRLRWVRSGGDVRVRTVREYGEPWVGRAIAFTCSGHVLLNAATAKERKYAGHRRALKRSATLHELGHIIGLDHTTRTRSAMSERFTAWRTGGRVYWSDRRALRHLYRDHNEPALPLPVELPVGEQ